jgi:hypothetical protein
LNSPVLKWPDHDSVEAAVRDWAARTADTIRGILAIGYFGSYARGDWGPGSDVDIVVIVGRRHPFDQPAARHTDWGTSNLPVPADLLSYTVDDWRRLSGRMGQVLRKETVWVLGNPPD